MIFVPRKGRPLWPIFHSLSITLKLDTLFFVLFLFSLLILRANLKFMKLFNGKHEEHGENTHIQNLIRKESTDQIEIDIKKEKRKKIICEQNGFMEYVVMILERPNSVLFYLFIFWKTWSSQCAIPPNPILFHVLRKSQLSAS